MPTMTVANFYEIMFCDVFAEELILNLRGCCENMARKVETKDAKLLEMARALVATIDGVDLQAYAAGSDEDEARIRFDFALRFTPKLIKFIVRYGEIFQESRETTELNLKMVNGILSRAAEEARKRTDRAAAGRQ